MRFGGRKRAGPPTVIIVSLIDVLMVVLIFMMVATSFKTHPAIKLALPESTQAKPTGENPDVLVVTIDKQAPHLYLGQIPVTSDKLETVLKNRVAANPELGLTIRADEEAPFGLVIKIMDIAKAAGIRKVNAFTRTPPPGR